MCPNNYNLVSAYNWGGNRTGCDCRLITDANQT